jgi:DME family drug/metabolite transporter
MPSSTARLQILLTALLFSTGGAAIKACSLTNWQIASFRSGVAALILIAGTRMYRGFSRWSVVIGIAYAATLISFVTANKLTTAANSVFLQSTAPLYIAAIGPWWLGEHLRRRDVPVMLAIAGGIGLLFVGGSVSASATDPARGNLIGALSGFCWCLTVMGLRWVERRDPKAGGSAAAAAAISGNVIACLVCLPLALPATQLTAVDLGVVGYLGVFQVGLAYILLTRAIRHVPAVEASLLLLAEPAFSPLWAWLVHHESPGFWPLLGGGVIVGASTWKTWRDARREPE